jgi:phospholipid/cholesterol/gamma-HCH transport system substrate-binding protein
MTAKQRPSLAELKVGIFVVVACAILAVAIFTIGSQVGLFEEQFWAITYLSNVSGLKPGDVVLLGGVEVGNVASVEISGPGQLPPTSLNRQLGEEIRQLTEDSQRSAARLREAEADLSDLEAQYESVVEQLGATAPQAEALAASMSETRDVVVEQRNRLERFNRDLDRTRSRLQNIEVQMRIRSEYRSWIRADSNISLGSIGLLGDKYIEISLGRTDVPPETIEQEIEGWIGTKTRELVLVSGVQQASFAELITGANDILANFETLSRQVQDIMRSFESGEGTIGRLITDPTFYDNLTSSIENFNMTADEIALLVRDLRRGPGTVGKLVQDDTLHERLASAVEQLNSILGKIEQGEGSLGRFVSDPAVYDRASELIGHLNEVAGRINSGEGTLGRLTTEDALYVSLQQSIEELSSILQDVEQGEGTLGRLAKDEELYQNINQLSSELIKLIYDFRQNPKEFLTIKFELF